MSKVVTEEFRVSYPYVFKPKEKKTQKGIVQVYQCVGIFKPDDLANLKTLATDALTGKYGADKKKWGKLKSPFRPNSERKDDETGIMPLGYEEGGFFVNFQSYDAPGVIGRDRKPILEPTEFYAGCYARAYVAAFAYDVDGNRGVSFWMDHLMKTRDGEPLTNRVRAEDAFSAIKLEDVPVDPFGGAPAEEDGAPF